MQDTLRWLGIVRGSVVAGEDHAVEIRGVTLDLGGDQLVNAFDGLALGYWLWLVSWFCIQKGEGASYRQLRWCEPSDGILHGCKYCSY